MDPRDELIALDLQQPGADLERRKHELLVRWLGGAEIAGRAWNPRRFRHGLLDDFRAPFKDPNYTYIDALYASPAAPYLGGVSMIATNLFAQQFEHLVERPHPSLRRLELMRFWSHAPSNAWHEAFEHSTPHLEELWIGGRGPTMDGSVRFSLRHPNIKRMVLDDSPIHLSPGQFPSLVELGFNDQRNVEDVVRCFPALECVDLAQGGRLTKFFAYKPFPEQIRRLRVAAPRDAYERRRILDYADELPNAVIEVAPGYLTDRVEPIEHPRIRTSEPNPWPPRHALSHTEYEGRTITLGTRVLSLKDFVRAMETNYHQLDETQRLPWREFWRCYATGDTMPAASLLQALSLLDDDGFTGRLGYGSDLITRWSQLVSYLRERLPPTAAVKIAAPG